MKQLGILNRFRYFILLVWIGVIISLLVSFDIPTLDIDNSDSKVISLEINPTKQDLQFYWKDNLGNKLKSIQQLKTFVESRGEVLQFAVNGGMYTEDNSPLGLYIEEYKTIHSLNIKSGNGNFYLKPNGVFYLLKNRKAVVCRTEQFKPNANIRFATQSGPMLVIDGKIHPDFKLGSTNMNIRNGVGVLPNGNILLAISKTEINFYDFALYFKQAGCKNALYLDGFVSRMYCPEKQQYQLDGNFGVMIGLSKKK
jgi:uncharacterized protein YigE (DUF2233 family)